MGNFEGIKTNMEKEKTGCYETMQEVINNLLEKQINYAILRNYENLLEDDIYMDGHGDVDLICSDGRLTAKAMGAIDHEQVGS